MTLLASPAPRRRLRWRQLRLSLRLCVLGLALLFLVAGLEGIARFYWWRVKGVARVGNEAIWRTTYTEVATSGLDSVAAYHGDRSFDVLLLGGSVLHHRCGDIAPRLRQRLEQKVGRSVRVINFAYPGRTSAESLMKYARLEDRRFDLVLLYDNINDAYLNNAPASDYRADYAHVRHIAQMRALDRHPEVGWFALPYTAQYVALNLGDRWGLTRGKWDMCNGAEVRTLPAFEANVEGVAELAERRGDPLLLATFAYHLPPDYTLAAFKAHQLDYARHLCPAETWGAPANLLRALKVHNEAIRRVAGRRKTLFVDVAGRLPCGRLCFDDPCHLTPEGCRQFVELIVEAVPARRNDQSVLSRAK